METHKIGFISFGNKFETGQPTNWTKQDIISNDPTIKKRSIMQPKVNLELMMVNRDKILRNLQEDLLKKKSKKNAGGGGKTKKKTLQQLIMDTPPDQLAALMKLHGY